MNESVSLPEFWRKWLHVVFTAFHADLRSLALARIAFGAVLLTDLANRAVYLEAHYSDFGVLPRRALLQLNWNNWYLSLHLLSGEPAVQAVLFILAGIFALMLLLGWRTRLATVASWFLLLSLHNRNPLILNSGDDLLRLLLFWGMFLPWGARWSIDRSLAQSPPGPDKVFSLGALAFFLQVAMLYVFTGLLKSGSDWWVTRLAVYYTLSFEMLRLPLGSLIYPFPEFLKFMTSATLWLELTGPLLFFIPFWNPVFRWLGIVAFTAFQLGLALTLMVGMFPWVSMASMLAFIPSATWRKTGPVFLDRLFDAVADIARRCRLRTGGTPYWKLSKVEGAVVLLLLAYVFAWNMTTLPSARRPIPTDLKWIAYVLKLKQKWGMFAPGPPKKDGWFVIPATLRDGQEVDLFRAVPYVNFDKPRYAAGEFGGARWRKYMRNIWLSKHRRHRAYYGRYLCRAWNENHDHAEQVVDFEIVFVQERTLPDYEVAPLRRTVMRRQDCFPKETAAVKAGNLLDFQPGDHESEL